MTQQTIPAPVSTDSDHDQLTHFACACTRGMDPRPTYCGKPVEDGNWVWDPQMDTKKLPWPCNVCMGMRDQGCIHCGRGRET